MSDWMPKPLVVPEGVESEILTLADISPYVRRLEAVHAAAVALEPYLGPVPDGMAWATFLVEKGARERALVAVLVDG
jgi:hypothetical protein